MFNFSKILPVKKEKALDAVNDLPQEFELEELIEKLILVEKVESGLKQLDEGKVITHNDLKETAGKW